MAELKGIPINTLPEAEALESSDQIIAYREDDGKAYRANASKLMEESNENISDAFSTTKSYSAGDYVIYNDALYKFTADKDIGAWDESVVEQTTIGEEISELNSDLINDGPGSHNSFFRGKYLGSSVTSAQASAISDGTFDDLYIGDYWTINSVNYRIACFDYFYRTGSSASLTTHHAVLVPDTNLYTAPMNSSNTTTGAYVGSAMYTCDSITVDGTTYTGLKNAISTIQSAFGSYIVEHEVYLQNATTSGYPSGGEWVTGRICDLMTEHMVYGGPVRQQMSSGGTNYTLGRIEKSQLPLFALDPTKINIRALYWLRDVVSSPNFALVANSGLASNSGASSVSGVRPYFLIS